MVTADGAITAAASIRNDTDQFIHEISLELSLQDAQGREVSQTDESLPFCPPRQECWWGAVFSGGTSPQFGKDYRTIASVKPRIVKDLGPRESPERVEEFKVTRDASGRVTGRTSSRGQVFVIGFSGGKPKSGMSVSHNGDTDSFELEPGMLPRAGDDESLRAFVYTGVGAAAHS